jgi:hypothetical protein
MFTKLNSWEMDSRFIQEIRKLRGSSFLCLDLNFRQLYLMGPIP